MILFSVLGTVIVTLVILLVMITGVSVYWRRKTHAHSVRPHVQGKATALTAPQYVWFNTNARSTDIVYKLDHKYYITFFSCRHDVIEGVTTGEFFHSSEINICNCLQKKTFHTGLHVVTSRILVCKNHDHFLFVNVRKV